MSHLITPFGFCPPSFDGICETPRPEKTQHRGIKFVLFYIKFCKKQEIIKIPHPLPDQEIKLCEAIVGVSQFRRVLDIHEESVNANRRPQNLIYYLYGSSYFLANSAIFSGGQPGTSIPKPSPIASN